MAQEFLTEEEELEQDKDVIEALSKAQNETSDASSSGWSAVEPVARTIENLANRFHVKIKDVKVTLESGRFKKQKDTVLNESYLELRVPELFSVLDGDKNEKPLQANEAKVFYKLLKAQTADLFVKTSSSNQESWLMSIEDTSFGINVRDRISAEEATIHRKTETRLDVQRIQLGLCEWNTEFLKGFFRGMKIPSVTGIPFLHAEEIANIKCRPPSFPASLTCSRVQSSACKNQSYILDTRLLWPKCRCDNDFLYEEKEPDFPHFYHSYRNHLENIRVDQ
jgi:hypothetical protein